MGTEIKLSCSWCDGCNGVVQGVYPERLPVTSGDFHGRSKSRLARVPLRSWMSSEWGAAICPDEGREIGASDRPGARLMGVGGSEWSEKP